MVVEPSGNCMGGLRWRALGKWKGQTFEELAGK
jgi:hypothetical protein